MENHHHGESSSWRIIILLSKQVSEQERNRNFIMNGKHGTWESPQRRGDTRRNRAFEFSAGKAPCPCPRLLNAFVFRQANLDSAAPIFAVWTGRERGTIAFRVTNLKNLAPRSHFTLRRTSCFGRRFFATNSLSGCQSRPLHGNRRQCFFRLTIQASATSKELS